MFPFFIFGRAWWLTKAPVRNQLISETDPTGLKTRTEFSLFMKINNKWPVIKPTQYVMTANCYALLPKFTQMHVVNFFRYLSVGVQPNTPYISTETFSVTQKKLYIYLSYHITLRCYPSIHMNITHVLLIHCRDIYITQSLKNEQLICYMLIYIIVRIN